VRDPVAERVNDKALLGVKRAVNVAFNECDNALSLSVEDPDSLSVGDSDKLGLWDSENVPEFV
jgi:hypothetical protein